MHVTVHEMSASACTRCMPGWGCSHGGRLTDLSERFTKRRQLSIQ